MRLFLAYAFDDGTKECLIEMQNALKGSLFKGHLTRLEHLHLTVLFLGEMAGHRVDALIEQLDLALNQMSAFTCTIGDLGAFKRGKEATLYARVMEGSSAFKALHQRLKDHLSKAGYDTPNQPYTPHVTLARRVLFQDRPQSHRLGHHTMRVMVNAITLYHSYRHHDQLIHEPLAQFTLSPSQ